MKSRKNQARVVFFRGQSHLDEAQHEAFARLLGPIVPHPTVPSVAGTEAVLDIDGENSRASYWHTDVTFLEAFPQFSVLLSAVIPPVGGDTMWANTVAVYEALPPVLRGLADQLWALLICASLEVPGELLPTCREKRCIGAKL